MSNILLPVWTEPDSVPDVMRYCIKLTGADGKDYDFIIDIPTGTGDRREVDVWLLGATVEVGDTPADGFATFEPSPLT